MESDNKACEGYHVEYPTPEYFEKIRSENESLSKIVIITKDLDGNEIRKEFNHAKLIIKGDGSFTFDNYILINEDLDSYVLLSVRPDMKIGMLEYKYPSLPWQVDDSFNYYSSKEIDDCGRKIYEKYYKKSEENK